MMEFVFYEQSNYFYLGNLGAACTLCGLKSNGILCTNRDSIFPNHDKYGLQTCRLKIHI